MTPLQWMFVGYSAMWLVIALYVGNLGRRQAALEREVAALHAALDAEAAQLARQGTGDGSEPDPLPGRSPSGDR
jgi:CcmD family protein